MLDIFKGGKGSDGFSNTSEMKNYELQIMNLKSQLEGFKQIASSTKGEYDGLTKSITNFCKAILDREYALSQLGDSKVNIAEMKVYDLISFALNSVEKQKYETTKIMIDMKNEIDTKERMIEDLKSQLSQMLVNSNLSRDEVMDIFNQLEKRHREAEKAKEPAPLPNKEEKSSAPREPKIVPIGMVTSGGKEQSPSVPSTEAVPIIDKVKTFFGKKKEVEPQQPQQPQQSVNTRVIEIRDEDIKDEVSNKNNGNTQQIKSEKSEKAAIKSEKSGQTINSDSTANTSPKTKVEPKEEVKAEEAKPQEEVNETSEKVPPTIIHVDKPKEVPISHVIDLKPIIANMTELQWKIFEAIGVYGLSERPAIGEYIIKNYVSDKEVPEGENAVTDSAIDYELNELKVLNAVNRERIATGWRNFFAYELAQTGVRIFKECGRFSGDPVVSELRKLRSENVTGDHGFGIKDCATILKEDLKYLEVTYDRKANTIELPNGEIYIPDVTGINPVTMEKEYFEYELGHHKQEDFNHKCTKMRMVTKKLHFVVPMNVVKRKLHDQVNKWILSKGGIDSVGVEIKITTTKNLRKNKWDCED